LAEIKTITLIMILTSRLTRKIKHLLGCLTMACAITGAAPTARAESPSTEPWQARWLLPPATPEVSLDGASWIWADEPGVNPTTNAPAGKRSFHATLDLPPEATITRATGKIAADNRFSLTINGTAEGSGDSWQHPANVEISKLLRPGRNAIVIHAENDPAQGAINAAGLIARFQVLLKDHPPVILETNAAWTGGTDAHAASGLPPVKVIGPRGTAPWTAVAPNASGPSQNLWTCWRKSFELAEIPTSAPTRIAVDSKYWLWVNGRLIIREGAVKRGPNPEDTYYDWIDLAPHLTKGKNQIAVLAWFFGKEGFSHKNSGKPGFLFEMQAGATHILSDTSWKTLRHPAFGQASNTPNFRLAESSVRFDAREDISTWVRPGFDDSAWSAPADAGAPPAAPWNRLWRRSIPQWKDFGLKSYTNATELPKSGGRTAITARLPYNAQITPWLKVSAPAGLMIRIRTDNPANEIFAEYITREGEQEFETPAWMSGHAVIYEIPENVRILGLQYRESGFDTELTGSFQSDNEFLNKLWEKCERTLYINMRDTFFDCPDRERAAWWGDIVIQLAQVFHTYDTQSHSLIRKCMYNLANWQRPSKTFFSPIPAGNWDKELPQQMLASIGQYGFWTYYLYTGDKKAITDLYPNVVAYLSIWQTDADGLIVHRSGENGWDWADWGDHVDIRMLDQAWFCLALEGAARMADELGKPDEAAGFRKQREALITAANTKFWNGSAYHDPAYKGPTDDRAQGMAVVSGIADRNKFPAIKTVLANTNHASPYIEKYILESLYLMGEPEAAFERLQRRYKEMVESETSTLWELFTRDGTLNHAWTGGPLTLMNQYMAGITPTSPAFATYQVKPQPGDLQRVNISIPTVKGDLKAAILRKAGRFNFKLIAPAGTQGTIHLPVKGPITLNGKPASTVAGATHRGSIAGHEVYEVGPGEWTFSAAETP
jgi:hypothetical protein